MSTPAGWFRMKLLVRSMREQPKKGSLQEWALVLYLIKEEEIEQARELAFAFLLLCDKENLDKALDTWKDYQTTARPYVKAAESKDRKDNIKVLMDEVKRGYLQVRPLIAPPPVMQSRLRVQEAGVQTTGEMNELYSRLRPIIRKPQ